MDTALTGYPLKLAGVLASVLNSLALGEAAPVCRFQGKAIAACVLLHKIHRLSAVLATSGIAPESRVGVMLPRSPDMIVVMLALWQCGAVYVPLDSSLPRERLLRMHEAVLLNYVIVAPQLREISAIPGTTQCVLTPIEYDQENVPLEPVPEPRTPLPDHAAYILFTSGSTGIPKAVAVSHGNLDSLMHAILMVLPLPSPFTLLGCSSFSFDIAMFEMLAPLLNKGCLVLADDETYRNPELLNALIRTERVTTVQATPSLWRLLCHKHAEPLPRLELAIATGEALHKALAGTLLTSTRSLWNLYGPTECTLWASAHQVKEQDLGADAPDVVGIGLPLPGYTLSLLPDDAFLTRSGELVIEGPGVTTGYCYATEEQQASFTPPDEHCASWRYRTGDRCRLTENGTLLYLGRMDSQVKFNGYRIDLEEIACHLRRHNSVAEACCLLVHEADKGDTLLAFLLWQAGEPNKNQQQLRKYLQCWLPDWMLPQRYIPLAEWPVGPTGKIDTSALLGLAAPLTIKASRDLMLCEQDIIPGTSESISAVVASIFCEVLEVNSVSLADNFFDLGGNSMLAATLVMTVNERFNSRLGIREVLSSPPTVWRMTQLLQQA